MSSKIYQQLNSIAALTLLLAFLIPTGLQAKQLVDFCMMSHHDGMEMANNHRCCTEEAPSHHDSELPSHDCGILGFCACNIGDTVLNESEWTQTTNKFTALLTEQADLSPFIITNERITFSLHHRLGQHDPPLWLMYDTFLM